ncbi:hypothetical protein BVY03_02150 [bacterium K02(2017)]|nr:hypothetical protein BVY03_02150 [bacterium K02(2017)]
MPYQFVVYTCINARAADNPKGCCSRHGSEMLHVELKKLAKANPQYKIKCIKSGCQGPCEIGPNIMVYGPGNKDSGGVWYHHVKSEDIQEIFQSHLIEGKPVTRLTHKKA